jgi:pimeloyl-ACP methyl ester carboxylesterase
MTEAVRFAEIDVAREKARIEYQWFGEAGAAGPTLVFLHEGLGSLATWKDFPLGLCRAAGARGLVYSRPGYGQSQALGQAQPWGIDFMHRQAYEILPALLQALKLSEPAVLIGHSDGASIALLYAARYPERVAALVVLAPHVFVEPKTLAAIAALQADAVRLPLLAKLGRYHRDADALFAHWSQAWLAPEFGQWSITDTIADLRGPVLAVQGQDDEYGTMAHIQTLARHHPRTAVLEFENCGHVPHRDQPELLTAATLDFLKHL